MMNDRNCQTWSVQPSISSMNTVNPIRQIVDKLRDEDMNPQKAKLSLSIGDPTVFGNLHTDPAVTQAIVKAVESGKCNGYAPSMGREDARLAVAKRYSFSNHQLKPSVSVSFVSLTIALSVYHGKLISTNRMSLLPVEPVVLWIFVFKHSVMKEMKF